MYIINASKRTVQVRVFRGSDPSCLTDLTNHVLNFGDYSDETKYPQSRYKIAASYYWEHDTFIKLACSSALHLRLKGDFPMGHIVCLFDTGGDSPYITNYSALNIKYRDELEPYRQFIDPLDTVLSSVIIAFSNFATSFSALGPIGALPAGIAGAIAGIISTFIQGENTEKPPSIGDIEVAVEHIVEEGSLKQDARNATVEIKSATNWLTETASLLDERSTDRHLYADFRRDLEDYVSQHSKLREALGTFNGYPEIGKYALPTYLLGATTWLNILRIHDAVRFLEGDKIGVSDIERYIKNAESLINGIKAAKISLQNFCDARLLKDEILKDSIFGQALNAIQMTKYTGVKLNPNNDYKPDFLPGLTGQIPSSLTFVDRAIADLNNGLAKVNEDIDQINKGGTMQNYLNQEWYGKYATP